MDDDGGCYPLTTKFKQQLKTKTKKITTTASCDGRDNNDNDNVDGNDVSSAASSKPAFLDEKPKHTRSAHIRMQYTKYSERFCHVNGV